MDSETRKEFKRLSKLTVFKDKSVQFIEHEAKKNIVVRELVRTGNFIDNDERKFAKSLFDKYLNNYDFENEVDLATLGVLVYNEVLVQRLQKSINEQKDSKGNFYLNDKIVKSLHDTQNHCLELKKQLGLDKEKSENELSAWQIEKKKLDLHIAFNRNEYTIVCSNCGELLLLRKKTKDFECLKHPFFSGRFWYNRRGMELVKNKIWTKEQYAWVFHTSVDYVNWCLENEGKIIEIEDFTKEEIEKFINNKDYLKQSKIPNNILETQKSKK
ncbi:MAG: hypothetical protein R6U15_07615 [Candidatus Izemoplasmatales bacterium]